MKKATVKALVLDKLNNAPVVLLGIEGTNKILPIWIGACEASAIAMILEETEFDRPLTYDLMINIIDGLEAKVEKVYINRIEDNTFYARLILRDLTLPEGEEEFIEFDARPSDAIILALKSEAPIYVSNEIVTEYTVSFEGKKFEDDDEKFKEFVENLNIEDFKKFKKGSQGDN